MLRFVQTNIFESPAQTLVNTVNTGGVMGKGIAKEFKSRYPQMYREYRHFCDLRELEIGALHVWRGPQKWVLNFPTKTTWKLPSKIKYVERGLQTFQQYYSRLGIKSISFPPLGCGNGNLNWSEIKPLMIRYLNNLDIPIWVHEKFYDESFLPEQLEHKASMAPTTFDEFLHDFHSVVLAREGRFFSWVDRAPIVISSTDQGGVSLLTDSRVNIEVEDLAHAWVGLKLGLLMMDHFGRENESIGGCVMAVAAELPYVRYVDVVASRTSSNVPKRGLYFNQAIEGTERKAAKEVA